MNISAPILPHYLCVCFVDVCRPSVFAIRKSQLNVISEATEEPSTARMAEYLASIFGTEKDKVNCSFFFKVMIFKMSRLLKIVAPNCNTEASDKIQNHSSNNSKGLFAQTGACTHGERCSRIHNKPTFSQTILLQNLYINPQNSAKTADGSHLANVTDEEMQEHYDNFFEDVFVECEDKYGQVEEMNVCDNLGDHLVTMRE